MRPAMRAASGQWMGSPHDAVATPDAHAVSDHRRGNGESAEGKHGRNEEAKGPGVFSRDRSAVVDHHRRFVTGCRLLLSKRRGDAKREEEEEGGDADAEADIKGRG